MPRYIYEAFIVDRVIDGDTVILTIDCGFYLHRRKANGGVSYRLARINAPELNQAGGHEAWQALINYMGNAVRVETLRDPDKYGRFLVEVTADLGGTEFNVNSALVEAGHAVFKSYA